MNRKMRSKLNNRAARAKRDRPPKPLHKVDSDSSCPDCGHPLSDHVDEITALLLIERKPPREKLH